MTSAGEPGTLKSRFTTNQFPEMAKEVEAAVENYQKLYGRRPDFVAIHQSIGINIDPHLTYNFFNREHQIKTRWHGDADKEWFIVGSDTPPR